MRARGGNPNYKHAEVLFLLDIVRARLPLGRDEWERIATRYNETKDCDWSERDYESLRRKFKMLCATKKPTGEAEMPGHIKTAKEIREEIDQKAGVVDCEDAPDVDDEVGFDHEYEFLEAEEETPPNANAGRDSEQSSYTTEQTTRPVELPQYWAPVEGNYTHNVAHGPSAFASMPFQTTPNSTALKKRAAEEEARRYPKMKDFSNRLGGQPLPSVDDDETVRQEKPPSKSEASFTKQKKVRSEL